MNNCKQKLEKFKVPDKSFASFYLPSCHSIFKRFKLPHNLPLMLSAAESWYGFDSKISRSDKYKMVGEGISPKHRASYLSACQQILGSRCIDKCTEKKLVGVLRRSYMVESNAGAWLGALQGFSQSRGNQELTSPLINFIRNRAEIDLAFLENSKAKGMSKKGNFVLFEWLGDFISQNTLVNNDVIKKAVEAHSKITSPTDYSRLGKVDFLNILRFNFSFEVDFYLSAIAIYDLWLHSFYEGEKGVDDLFFLDVSMRYSKQNGVRNIFEGLLDALRWKNINQVNEPLSWHALAQHIDTLDPHNLMNKWRSGKELPSSSRFSSFINEVDFPKYEVGKFIAMEYMSISIAFDALISDWSSKGKSMVKELEQLHIQITEEELDDLIGEVVCGLSKYYEAFGHLGAKK